MGVTVQKGDSKYVYDKSTGYGKIVSDVNVIEVAEDSIASKIGFKVDDKILTFKVNTIVYELEQYFTIDDVLYNVRAGDVLSFTCLRDGVEITTNTYTVMPADIKKID